MINGVSAYQRTYSVFVREVEPVTKIQQANKHNTVENIKTTDSQKKEGFIQKNIHRGQQVDILV